MRIARHTLMAVALALLAGCGAAAELQIEVRWSGHQPPAQLEQLHFQLGDADGVLAERSFEVPDDAPPALLTLAQGPHTPAQLALVVLGLRGDEVVTRSSAQPIDFERSGAAVVVDLP